MAGWKFALLGIVIAGCGVAAVANQLSGMNWEAPSQSSPVSTAAALLAVAAIIVGIGLLVYGLFH